MGDNPPFQLGADAQRGGFGVFGFASAGLETARGFIRMGAVAAAGLALLMAALAAAGAVGLVLTLTAAAAIAVLTILVSALVALFSLAWRFRRRTPSRAAEPGVIEARKVGHAWVAYGFNRPHS